MLWNLNKQKKWSTIQRIAVGLNISKKEATIAFLLYYDWIHTICNPNVNIFIVTKSVFSYIKITSIHYQDTKIVLFDSFLNICKKYRNICTISESMKQQIEINKCSYKLILVVASVVFYWSYYINPTREIRLSLKRCRLFINQRMIKEHTPWLCTITLMLNIY